jgi:hypothetical protein
VCLPDVDVAAAAKDVCLGAADDEVKEGGLPLDDDCAAFTRAINDEGMLDEFSIIIDSN